MWKNKEMPKELKEYISKEVYIRVVSLLALYREKGHEEFDSFELFVETLCKQVLTPLDYDLYMKRTLKKLKNK